MLGFDKIFLAAHDVRSQTAFSYTAAHPNNVTKLVLMDFFFPGYFPPALGQNGPWWFSFYQQQEIPEMLVQGHEREYISSFMSGLAYNPSAIKDEDIDIWTSHAVSPGTLRGSFEHFRAFSMSSIIIRGCDYTPCLTVFIFDTENSITKT